MITKRNVAMLAAAALILQLAVAGTFLRVARSLKPPTSAPMPHRGR